MRFRLLLLVVLAAFVVAGVWTYKLYMGHLNNSIALQRCVLEVKQKAGATGNLPPSIHCRDHWGEPIAYFVREGTYVLVSAGSDQETEANYGSMHPGDISPASTCFTTGADAVFVGGQAVRSCLK